MQNFKNCKVLGNYKMKKLIVFLIFALFVLISARFVEAKILFAKPARIYNFGDKIEQQIAIVVNQNFEGFLKVVLQCKDQQNTENLIYFAPLQLKANSEKKIDLSFNYNSTGLCSFFASLENDLAEPIESATSEDFLITDAIVFELELNKKYFMPSDELKLKGEVKKKSGEAFTGKADLKIFDKNFSVAVTKGVFSFSVKVPENAKPGNNTCFVAALDDFGNKGYAVVEFKVASIASSLIIEVSNETILPGETLKITPKLIDQSNFTIPENVSLRLFKKREFLIFQEKTLLLEELLVSGNSTFFRFSNSAEPGDYFLEAYSQGFKATKTIYVPAVEKIDINLSNGILIVKNIGNVPYKKPLQFELSLENFSRTLLIDLNLDVNETQTFELRAPKGTYDVTFKVAGESKNFQKVPLLGDVVATINLSKKRTTNYLWLFVLAVIAFLVYLLRKKIFKKAKKSYVRFKTFEEAKETKPEEKEAKLGETSRPDFKKQKENFEKQNQKMTAQLFFVKPASIESSVEAVKKIFLSNASILKACYIEETKLLGVPKKQVSIVCCNVHNLKQLENLKKKNTIQFERIANNLFHGIVKIIKSYDGVADLQGNTLIILFLQPDLELNAIKTANEIRAFVGKFNEQLKEEGLDFTFEVASGVHSGLLAFTISDKIVRYAENETMKIARALAKKARKNEILLSSMVYMKIASFVQVKRITPLCLEDKKAVECFLLQHPAPSEVKQKDEGRVRKFLENL
ncbi:MAG: hypothetical protein QXL88_02335 [Candidatus Pacearchaeota archaeon]